MQGTLIFWRISRHGGMGKVYADGELFFLHAKFILSGLPVVGCSVTFVPQKAREGTSHRQARDARIDNTKMVRTLDVVIKDKGTPRRAASPRADRRPLAVLTGEKVTL